MAPPKWRQLADDFARRIREGELAPGDPLPQIRELTSAGIASTTTVQAAYRALEGEGLVRISRGKGTFVRKQRSKIVREPQNRYPWEKKRALLTEEQRAMTGVTEHDTGLSTDKLRFSAEFSIETADAHVADLFEAPAGTRVLHRKYWTSSKEESAAISLVDSWILYELASKNPDLLDSGKEPWPGGTLHQLSTVGVEVSQMSDRITARPPTVEEKEKLDLEPGTSVFVLYKTSYDLNGAVAEVSRVILPGDRFELLYHINLERWSA